MNTPTLIIKTPIDQLESEIVTLHARLCAEEYQFLVKLREFDLRRGWEAYHFNHCAEWLNMKCGISLSTGREKLRVAKALFFLPHISGAYQNGELSYSKVRAMTRVATEITERELLGYARKATASQVDQHCAGLRNVQQKFSTPSANRAHDQRSLRVTPTGDGRFLLNGELPEESARLVLKALELCMAQARREEDPSAEDLEELENPSDEELSVWDSEDPAAQRAAAVKRDQQQADALVDIAQVYLAGGTERKASTADHYQVLVHVDEAALRGRPNTDSKSDLPIETVRRLCCDGSVVAVTESKESSAAKVRISAEAPDRANTSADAFEISPATSADNTPVTSTVDPQNSTLTDLACNPSRDASELAAAVSSNGSTGVIPAVTPVDSHNGVLTDLVDDPSRDAFALAPATSADDAVAGSTVDSPNGKLTDLAGNPSRDEFAVSPATSADDTVAGSTVDSPNGKLTDLVDDPSRDAFALAPATSADDTAAGSTVDSPNGKLTDLAGNPSRDAFEMPPATAPNAAAGRSRPSLNLSRKHRLVQPALRRALEARDRGCRFPGCSHERWLDAHHVVHWADGGETSLDNTLLLCSRHHRLLHEGGFAIRADANGEWQFQNANGMKQVQVGY